MIQFSSAQQEIIDARGKNILVSASAGAGKTGVLVERLCQMVIKERISLDHVLAMTFTEDAAGEMKTRLKQRLQQEDQEDPYIRQQLSLLETASISTIHGFCLDLVQKYYYQLGIPFSMAKTVENGLLNSQALSAAYTHAVESLNPKEYSDLKLYMESFGKNEKDLQELILDFLEIAKTKPNPDAWMESTKTTTPKTTEYFYHYFELRVDILISIMEEMIENVQNLDFPKAAKQMEWIQLFEVKAQALKEARHWLEERQYEKFAKRFLDYISQTGKFAPTINKVKFTEIQKDSRALEKEIADVLFYRDTLMSNEKRQEPLRRSFIDLARMTRDEFQKQKRQMKFIDFSDMEQFAWDLLQNDKIRQEVNQKYQVILVDEYQDTNDLQEGILSMAAGENYVFRVGDVKQSIYGFRQARPQLMRSLMEKQDDTHALMVLNENFRSSKSIIDFNNEFFSTLMNIPGMESQFSEPDFAKPGLASQDNGLHPARFLYTEYGGWQKPDGSRTTDIQARSFHKRNRIDLIAKDILEKMEESKKTARTRKAREIEAAGGDTAEAKELETRPLREYGAMEFRDFVILTRASTNHNAIKEGLEAWKIPVLGRSRKGFYTNPAVQIVLSVLKILVNPHDDVALMAVLCSPIGGCKASQVVEAASGRKSEESLYSSLQNLRMLNFLKEDMNGWQYLPIGEVVEKIYNYKNFYYNQTTSLDKTNLDLFLEKAAQVEEEMNLGEFVDLVSKEEEFDETGEAAPFGKEDDVVRITTIHSSKGLEYPVVYLLCEDQNRDMDDGSPVCLDADLGISMMALSENMHIKSKTLSHVAFKAKRFMEDQQEKMRLMYVACTRARDELVLVDTVKTMDDYDYPLNLRAIWKNKGFTGWAAHIFLTRQNPLYKLEEKDMAERPEAKKDGKNFYVMKKYEKPVEVLYSKTASAAGNIGWNEIKIGSSKGMERGTLFHNMAEKLSYPYQKQDVLDYAASSGYDFTDNDLKQFLDLNNNKIYKSWMGMNHQFEAPYSVMEDNHLAHGFMDLLVQDPEHNTIHILDFKTDAAFDMDSLIRHYRPQLATYSNALKSMYPDKSIHTWIYSFYLSELKEII